jgi:DNA-binding response OmpR family regulator
MLKKKIFIVDDEKDILELFQECFSTDDNQIFTFENHLEAIKASQVENPDLIILDANLKGVSGLQIVHDFQQEIPKYLFSGNTYNTTPKGFTGVLTKPFSMEDMMKLIG